MAEQIIEGWLTDAYDYERPRRGQIRDGLILRIEEHGIIVDVGLKREGFVAWSDIERLGEGASSELQPGQEITTRVVKPEDREGNLILSVYQARLEKDWRRAQESLESGEVWRGKVTGFNRGGLTVEYGRLHGFVPGSHLWARNKRFLPSDRREETFKEYVGQELPLTVIEVERHRRRLIMSERVARRKLRQRRLDQLLEELLEGDVCRGTVSRICDFGAFVDLGGADGLIHISELSWRRIRHPGEVVKVGDEVRVYILRLDHERKRIGLSLKRLQADPWSQVDRTYEQGQLVSGCVTSIADFGAFAALDLGIEGLIHVSELGDPRPEDPRAVVQVGDELVLRVLRIEPNRRRIGLSLKRVSEDERVAFLRATELDQAEAESSDDRTESGDGAASAEDITLFDEAAAVGDRNLTRGLHSGDDLQEAPPGSAEVAEEMISGLREQA